MAMLTLANEILLVVTPEVGALRNSAQFLGLAREVGLGDIVRVVVNRANHGIRLPDIEEVLKLPVSATVVSNGPKAIIASNEGQPVISKFPREKISTDLHNVARIVVQGSAPAVPRPSDARGWPSSSPAPRTPDPSLAPGGDACAIMRRPCRRMTTSAASAGTPSR